MQPVADPEHEARDREDGESAIVESPLERPPEYAPKDEFLRECGEQDIEHYMWDERGEVGDVGKHSPVFVIKELINGICERIEKKYPKYNG